MKVGVIGATGYTGHELLRLLRGHPEAEVVFLGSSGSAGRDLREIYPGLPGEWPELTAAEPPPVDILFCALPSGAAAGRAARFLAAGGKVIDLSADFRLRDPADYEVWYKWRHPAPEFLPEAVYGLPEFYRAEIAGARLVANPGCYPTAALLALRPLLLAGLLEPASIIIDAASGVSGAGRALEPDYLFTEINENFKPYGVASHRHTPEIEQELSAAAGEKLRVSFTPHLLPVTRGILATVYARPRPGVSETDLRQCWEQAYEGEHFVVLLPAGVWPQTKFAFASNFVFLQLKLDERTGRVVAAAAIDNLVRGAAGQAVQNMNIMYGRPEEKGLEQLGLWP
ncbi:MAG: N-acetyl-gamma-glutamyl-phosphate reductase [Gracilibacteraceae bacterium]|nr:N-acetyl-gamma-glutamyl-phosphate reductase [Gracilibacteraceae bacterium]